MAEHVLAIDEGGTGVRAHVFDQAGRQVAAAYEEIPLAFPRPGWVEHDATAVWDRTVAVIARALADAGLAGADLCGIGIANQRASVVVWHADTGVPVHPAIGWQDLRSIEHSADLARRGHLIVPSHSATKFAWIVDNVPGARALADAGRLRFGTFDTWLAWKLSGGSTYVTDPSNACCTGLYDYYAQRWDPAVMEALGLPVDSFPEIVPTSTVAGESATAITGRPVPLGARAGDQQAAMFGELRLRPGMTKISYGTAAMMDLNVGETLKLSPGGAFPLVLWWLGDEVTYCLEASVITAGAAIQWLRDGLGIIAAPAECDALAASAPDSGGVWCVPAFQGLGQPHLDDDARALIGGLSRSATRAHVVRAVLEGIACRCSEILAVLQADAAPAAIDVLRVDGGAARSDVLMQIQADVAGIPLERAAVLDAASLGAAYLAGLATGLWRSIDDLQATWRCERVFEPRTSADERAARLARWQRMVAHARTQPTLA